MSEILAKIAEILDVEAVGPEAILADIPEWDSLSVLSFLAMADASYGVTVKAEDIAQAKTVGDLVQLIDARRAK